MTLTIRSTTYSVELLSRVVRLQKPDGTLYDVVETPYGLICDCPDFVWRREGLDPRGCKHTRAVRNQRLLLSTVLP